MTILLYMLLALFIFVLGIFLFLQHPKFGKKPSGERLERIRNSPHYRDGEFQNINFTPPLAEDTNGFTMMKDFFFSRNKRVKPKDKIPSIKTDLLNLDPNEDILVWFGHSSYFMQIDGKRILVDPVFSPAASPISFTVVAYDGTNIYSAADFPEIDYLFMSHDHWDHMDYKVLLELKPKVKNVICGLGTGAHFEYWGFDKNIIHERDWYETITLKDNFVVHTVPSRHFSGRGFKRNQALWTSFVLQTPTTQIFLGGDSGYDTHFAEAGKKFGVFDIVILENGQYNKNWKYIHMHPNEVLQAAKDLNAKRLFPVHSGKFTLSNHDWDGPLSIITELNKDSDMGLITPQIGEKVALKDETKVFPQWWTTVD